MNPDARLRNALAPVDPPDGFAQRVRARVAREAAVMPAPARRRVPRWMAIAALVSAVLASPLAYREYESRREAIAARAQVLLALQIVSRELNSAHRKVVRPVVTTTLAPADAGDSGKVGRP
ncbi:hypothetical protein LuPra_03140 [Luteitalea pratensis]|uniref:Uncharacterized protein n=1 Tax=Luteitalea pratensis TaxID=1855912 RepID=A0A143PP24_LUTPR|nr:hypothetical protein [Luteitalea pratensis]AMY09913.1 hypothetical protein LuPra_03140 [Luteitalea pratensis]